MSITGGILRRSYLWSTRSFSSSSSTTRYFKGHGFCIPHPSKIDKGGEDAMFHSKRALAVADGVGGWQRVGVDPANYSNSLIRNLEASLPIDDQEIENSIEFMKTAYYETAAAKVIGSSTLCIVTLRDGVLDLKSSRSQSILNNYTSGNSLVIDAAEREAAILKKKQDEEEAMKNLFSRSPSGRGVPTLPKKRSVIVKKKSKESDVNDSSKSLDNNSGSSSSDNPNGDSSTSVSDSDSDTEMPMSNNHVDSDKPNLAHTPSQNSDLAAIVTVANVGDSGALIFRPSSKEVIFRSLEQTHDFNFPKQLGYQSDDLPEDSDVDEVQVEVGDLVLCASDGLFDNMYDNDICDILGDDNLSIQDKMITLAKTAYAYSLNPNYFSPFADREKAWLAKKHPNGNLSKHSLVGGGKSDDISVILAEIE